MLYKKELLEIPVSKRNQPAVEGKLGAAAKAVKLRNGERICVIDVYFSLNKEVSYRIYLTKDNDMSYNLDSKKWLTGEVYNVLNIGWYRPEDKGKILKNEKVQKLIAVFTKQKVDITGEWWNTLRKEQRRIRDARLKRRDMDYVDKVTAEMGEIPQLPDDFRAWVNESALYQSRYTFYDREKTAYCTHCGKWMKAGEKIRHGKPYICPECGVETIGISTGKTHHIFDNGRAYLIHRRSPEEFLVRIFHVSKKYRIDNEKMMKKSIGKDEIYLSIYEGTRYIVDAGSGKIKLGFEYENYKQRFMTWCKTGDLLYVYGRPGSIYPVGKDSLRDSVFENMGLDILSRQQCDEYNMYNIIKEPSSFRYIEYLAKNGLYQLAADASSHKGYAECARYATRADVICRSADKIKDLLRVEKYDIPFLAENRANMTGLEYVQDVRKKGKKPVAEHMKFIQSEFRDKYGEFLWYEQYGKTGKVIKYMTANNRIREKSKQEYYQLWKDYLNMAKEIGYDFSNDFVTYPRSLKERHDQAIDVMNEQKREKEIKKDAGYRKIYKRLCKKYAFEYKGLCIVVPECCEDLAKEGQKLHHCVGGYWNSVRDEKTVILFIRKAAEKTMSYFTMEVKNGKIVQCRGLYNCAMSPDVTAFTKAFTSRILKGQMQVVPGDNGAPEQILQYAM